MLSGRALKRCGPCSERASWRDAGGAGEDATSGRRVGKESTTSFRSSGAWMGGGGQLLTTRPQSRPQPSSRRARERPCHGSALAPPRPRQIRFNSNGPTRDGGKGPSSSARGDVRPRSSSWWVSRSSLRWRRPRSCPARSGSRRSTNLKSSDEWSRRKPSSSSSSGVWLHSSWESISGSPPGAWALRDRPRLRSASSRHRWSWASSLDRRRLDTGRRFCCGDTGSRSASRIRCSGRIWASSSSRSPSRSFSPACSCCFWWSRPAP